MPRVTILTGGAPHYRRPFFEALGASGCELDVIAAGKLGPGFFECSGSDNFRLHRLSSGGTRWRSDVVHTVRRLAPDIIVSEHGASLDYVWTALLSPTLRQTPKVLWTHGIARQELYGAQRGLGSWGRWTQLYAADGIVCYDLAMADRLRSVFSNSVVTAAPNSNDGRPISAERTRLQREGQVSVRARLQLRHKYYVVGVGRLVIEKQYHRLIPVLQRLRSIGLDVGLILIGDGPQRGQIENSALEAGFALGDDVRLYGTITDARKLTELLFVADVCVSPGPLGLSVVDCLFAGLPTITFTPGSKGPWHGPEWRYLIPQRTGFFADSSTDRGLADACSEYLSRPSQDRCRVADDCASFAHRELGVERMVKGMREAIDQLLAQRR